VSDKEKDSKKSEVAMMEMESGTPKDVLSLILEDLKKKEDNRVSKIVTLAFEENPNISGTSYKNLYKSRTAGLPPDVAKRIRDSEELVGGIIIPTKAKQATLFSRPRANRFDVGYTVNLKPDIEDKLSDEEKKKVKLEIIPKLKEILLNCGSNAEITDKQKRNLSQFFYEIVEDLLTYGGFAVEVIKDDNGKFHSFRARDAGTIYFINKKDEQSKEAEKIRQQALIALQQLLGEKIQPKKLQDDQYTYAQVLEGMPAEVFTDDELIFWNAYPSTDVNRNGYPVSPLERILSAITTHINLTTSNKLFFINGRSYKSVMVFKSEDLEKEDIINIKNQMTAHINSAGASGRLPVFGIKPTDEISIVSVDPSSKDMEYQYLADLNKRIIFAGFQMSPDEVPALSYLSRGTNSQSLAESNNEFKTIAARDAGIRPLLMSIEDFFNERLLPKINPEWANMVQINLEGLDANSPEKESTLITQDASLFLTMNDIMHRVENEDVPIGGDFPLNPAFQQVIEKYFKKGEILKAFGGKAFANADKDPDLQYYMGDPVWLQMQQMKMQQQAMAQQQGQPPQGGQGQQQLPELAQSQDLDSAIGQLDASLSKSEANLSPVRKDLLKKHRAAKKKVLDQFEKDSKDMAESLLAAINGQKPHKCEDGHE
jgi:hypothetical protein